jgi:hypothetical protein
MIAWSGEDWEAYKAWMRAWLAEHEHELPRQVRSKNGTVVPLGKKHRWRYANDAWREMRRRARAEARRA